MFDTSTAYEYVEFGNQVITSSTPTPDEFGGFITAGTGGVRGWDETPPLNALGEQTGRTLALSGAIKAPEGRVRRDQMFDDLVAAAPMDEPGPIIHYRDGEFWHIRAVLGSASPLKDIVGPRKANYAIQFFAKDPRRLSGRGDGYEYSDSGPLAGPGTMTMTNTGNGYTPPMELRFRDCVRPRINVIGSPTGDLWLDMTVSAGNEVRVDLETHQAFLADGTDVTGSIRGEFPLLDRKTNTFNFSAAFYGSESLPGIFWLNSKL